MNNTAHVGSLPLPNVGTDWNIAGAADFNGDLKADILLQNKVTGSRTIWLMNGPTRVSSVNLPTVSTQWSIRNM
jgi:hypothetical protein